MHLKARQVSKRYLTNGAAALLAIGVQSACGLQGFNTAPGPNAPPAPLQCDVEVIKGSTLPVWSGLTLTANYNACAGCHIGGDPLGAGLGWGVANDTSDEGWHWATLQLMARDTAIAGDDVTLAPFFKNFTADASDPTHPENTIAQGELATVYATFRTSGGTACAPDPVLNGDCENPAFAKFVELGLGTSINTCATCHFTGTKTGRGISWGNNNDPSSEAWYLAVRGLQLQADQVGLATQNTSLYTHFSPGNAQHPKNDTLAAAMGTFIDTFRTAGEGDCDAEPEPAVEPEPEPTVEPEPEPEPEPLPPPECLTPFDPIEAQSVFDTTLKTPLVQCSSCHRAGPNPNNGNLRFTDADAYAMTLERIALDTGIDPKDTLMGKIMRVPGSTPLATHNYVYTQPDAAGDWLRKMNFGVEVEGCGDAGVALCAAPYPAAESESYFDDELKTAFFSCSSCHRASPSAANGNLSFDALTAYDAALAVLNEDAANLALPAAQTRIGQILRVPGSTPLATHNYGYTKGNEALTWIEYHRGGYEAPCP